MRTFILTFLICFPLYAQIDVGSGTTPCTDITFLTPTSDNTYECSTVNITSINIGSLNDSGLPLIIKATDAVIIGDVLFEGQNGSTGPFAAGGASGPGGGGGGSYFGSTEAGNPVPRGGNPPASGALCPDAVNDTAEGSGGAGGSLSSAGSPGKAGATIAGGGIVAAPGTAGTTVSLDVNSFNFAGSGGGTGVLGCVAPGIDDEPGSGGGGGGGIRIVAAGDITINGLIDVSGGNGGNGSNLGGGGGGGSGGIVILQTLSQINLAGTLDARFGSGGINGSASTNAGDGGDGAQGIIILEDQDGTVSGGVILGPAPIIRPVGGPGQASKLKSDISCGTVSKQQENSKALFQILSGFALAFLMGSLLKTLSRFRGIT
jgi:hypothetical protein